MDWLRSKIENYKISYVCNADETGLLFAANPSRSYILGYENRSNVHGTSLMHNKQRVTMMVCTNADGNHKLSLYFIGKSKSPRFFLDAPQSAVQYTSQKSAWMDLKCMHDWLFRLYA